MQLLALKDLPNGVKAGTLFTERDDRALVLIRLDLACVPPRPARASTKALEPEPAAPEPAAPEDTTARRRYRRQDLEAEP